MKTSIAFFCVASLLFSTVSTGNAQDTVESPEAQKQKLSPLEFVQKMAESDADGKFVMLPQVSPRGVDKETRAKMLELLAEELGDKYPDIRARAATAIGLFREDAVPYIPELLKLIGDPEQTISLHGVYVFASEALSEIGVESIEPVMEKMVGCDAIEYNGLAGVISELGEHEEARAKASVFVDLLKNGPRERRWPTMFCLSKLGEVAKPAIPEYIKNLDDKNFNVQVISCRALAVLGADSKDAVPKLLTLMEKDPKNLLSTRTHAAMCLGAIGPVDGPADELIKKFESMIEEPNAFCQERGLIALGRLGELAKGSAGFVEGLLENKDFSQRPEAALAHWQITGEADKALAELEKRIDDHTYDTRVLKALESMGPAGVPMLDVLLSKLESNDSSLHLMIAEIMVAMGKEGAAHVAKIRPLADTAPPEIAIQLDDAIAKLESIR